MFLWLQLLACFFFFLMLLFSCFVHLFWYWQLSITFLAHCWLISGPSHFTSFPLKFCQWLVPCCSFHYHNSSCSLCSFLHVVCIYLPFIYLLNYFPCLLYSVAFLCVSYIHVFISLIISSQSQYTKWNKYCWYAYIWICHVHWRNKAIMQKSVFSLCHESCPCALCLCHFWSYY
jgi:hypothetical protein